jgi:hypothetical protein
MLYAAPFNAEAVLMINPRTNVTDFTTLGGLGTGGNKLADITYVALTDTLFAAPYNADAVLMINPRTNVTDTTTLAVTGAGAAKYWASHLLRRQPRYLQRHSTLTPR